MEQMLFIGNKIDEATALNVADAVVKVLDKLSEVHASETIQSEALALLRASFSAPSHMTITNCNFDASTRKEVVVNTEKEGE